MNIIQSFLRRTPRLPRGEYARLQKEDWCSFESENDCWRKGQQRYIKITFSKLDKKKGILDIACGDGVGLREFEKMGFKHVVGIEFNRKKAKLAREFGYKVYELDMHKLSFKNKYFDVIYSSHTLEHAYDVKKALRELKRVLKDDGTLSVVLPYPDPGRGNIKAHVAKFELGLDKLDKGASIIQFFKSQGFIISRQKFDDFRQPEIWLTLKKNLAFSKH